METNKTYEQYVQQYKDEIKRLKSDNEALRISAKFQSDDDIEANLRNQVYNLNLEVERLKEENERLKEAPCNFCGYPIAAHTGNDLKCPLGNRKFQVG